MISVQGGLAPGWSGAITAGIERDHGRYGAHARQAGARVAYEQAAALLETPQERVVMVGDDLEVDISMALNAGAPGVLVLSGTDKRDKLDGRWQPTAIVNDVTEVPALLGG